MTGLLLIIGILLVAASAWLAVRAMTMRQIHVARAVARASAYGYSDEVDVHGWRRRERRLQRAIERAVTGFGRGFERRLLGGTEEELRALLRGAGFYRATPGSYGAARLAVLVAAIVASAWLWTGGLTKPLALFFTVIVLAAAWLLPPTELRRRRTARLRLVDRGLTDLVEFLVVTVEAGVGLGGALATAAERFRAPLGDELRLTVREQSMGLSTEEALRNFLVRCDTPMVRSFVRSILQAETLGVSIGQILRGLAVEMRRRRRQAAEERAHKAPVKIVFPLAFLILPAMFIVVVGPAVRNLLHTFGG